MKFVKDDSLKAKLFGWLYKKMDREIDQWTQQTLLEIKRKMSEKQKG
jgi:hypothetical protein